VTHVQDDFSIEAPTPNVFSSSSNLTSSFAITTAIVLGFSHSKHTIKSGITILASYSNANLITSHVPPNFSQCAKLGNVDPTIYPLCCEPIGHKKTSRNPKKV